MPYALNIRSQDCDPSPPGLDVFNLLVIVTFRLNTTKMER